MRITLSLLLLGLIAAILLIPTSKAADFGELEVIPNSFNPSLPTHNDLILDIDNLTSDIETSGTVSGLVGDFVYLENSRTDGGGNVNFRDKVVANYTETAEQETYLVKGTLTYSGGSSALPGPSIYGNRVILNGSGTIEGAPFASQFLFGTYAEVDSTADVKNLAFYYTEGGLFKADFSGSVAVGASVGVYGINAQATGDLGTAANTLHIGGNYVASGTADENFGIMISASGATTNWALYALLGDVFLGRDDAKTYWGTGSDASIYYDGSDLYIDPQVVGSGDTIFNAGKVGIGLTNPSVELDVAGAISATGAGTFGSLVVDTDTLVVGSDTATFIGPSFPLATFERQVANTTGVWAVNRFTAKSTGNMTDGFGPAFVFALTDTGVTDSAVCIMQVERDGGDTSGRFHIRTKNAGTYNTAGFNIDPQNRVGIGTINPLRDLHIYENANESTIVLIENPNTGQNAHAGFKLANNLGNTDGAVCVLYPSTHATAANQYYFKNYEGPMSFVAKTATSISLGLGTLIADADDLVIASNSNVGIGTTDPQAKLDVRGDIDVRAAGPDISLIPDVGDEFGFHVEPGMSQAWLSNETDKVHYVFFDESHGLYFGRTGNVSKYCFGAGNVGFGTEAPSVKVDVVGAITATGDVTSNKLVLTNTSGTYDDILTSNLAFGVQSTYVGVTPAVGFLFLGPRATGSTIFAFTDGDGGTLSPFAAIGSTTSATFIEGEGPLNVYASHALGTGGDKTDYVQFKTTSDIPEILAVGSCDLKINAGGSNDLLLCDAGGNVGIGTINPTALFDVNGLSNLDNVDIDGTVGIGIAPTASIQLYVDKAYTGGTSNYGGFFGVSQATNITTIAGLGTTATSLHTVGNQTQVLGYFGGGVAGSVGTDVVLGGVLGSASVTSPHAPVIGIAYGVSGICNLTTTGTTISAASLYAQSITKTSGTITTACGLLVDAQTAGATNYAIKTAAGTVSFGDSVGIGITNPSVELDIAGDTIWTGAGSGVPYGCMEGIDEAVFCEVDDTWYQVTFDTAGVSNLTTINLTNNDMAVTYAGDYWASAIGCFSSAQGHDFELMVKTTDGEVDKAPHLFQSTPVAAQIENVSGSCLITLSAGERVELWVRQTDAGGQTATFAHTSLAVSMVGGD